MPLPALAIPLIATAASSIAGAIASNNQPDSTARLRDLAHQRARRLRVLAEQSRGQAAQDTETGLLANAQSAVRTQQAQGLTNIVSGLGSRSVNPGVINQRLSGILAPSEANLASLKNQILTQSQSRKDMLRNQALEMEAQANEAEANAEAMAAQYRQDKSQAVQQNLFGGLRNAASLFGTLGVGGSSGAGAATGDGVAASAPATPVITPTPSLKLDKLDSPEVPGITPQGTPDALTPELSDIIMKANNWAEYQDPTYQYWLHNIMGRA